MSRLSVVAVLTAAMLAGAALPGCGASADLDGPTAPGEVTLADVHRELDAHGTWLDSRVGPVFKPNAPPDFVPYLSSGSWVAGEEGWEFESDDPWALTYHYGRWFKDGEHGWVWAPDTVWGPSWVEWREGDPYIGWYVMPPLGFTYDAYGWVWVRTTDFVRPRVAAHVIRGDEVQRVWTVAQPVPRGAARFGGQWSVGPSAERVGRVAAAPVPRPRMIHGHGGHGRGGHGHGGGGKRR